MSGKNNKFGIKQLDQWSLTVAEHLPQLSKPQATSNSVSIVELRNGSSEIMRFNNSISLSSLSSQG